MNVGKITESHIGQWYLDDTNKPVKILGCMGNLIRCQTLDGIVWIPIFDIQKRITEQMAKEIISKQKISRKAKESQDALEDSVKKKKERNSRLSKKPLGRRIVAIDSSGNEHAFDSITEASIALKVNQSCISEVANNKRKTAGGYKWRFEKIEHEDA